MKIYYDVEFPDWYHPNLDRLNNFAMYITYHLHITYPDHVHVETMTRKHNSITETLSINTKNISYNIKRTYPFENILINDNEEYKNLIKLYDSFVLEYSELEKKLEEAKQTMLGKEAYAQYLELKKKYEPC